MRDDFFNAAAAAKVEQLVMAMPEPEAREFAKHVTYGMLHEQIESNRRTVFSKVDQIHRELLRAALRTPLAHEMGPVIEVVAKAEGEPKRPEVSRWEIRYHPKRDKRGRFATREERNRAVRAQRGQAKLRQQMNAGGFQARVPAYDKENKPVTRKGKPVYRTVTWDKTRREEMTGPQSQAAFDLVQSLSGQRTAHAAGHAGDFVGGVKSGKSAFENKWYEAGSDDFGTNARTYRRIQAGAQLLGEIDRSPQGQIAAELGQFVGQHGPMAEKVLGPHARRTAYRYRGTEKAPSKDLVEAADYMAMSAVAEQIPLRSAQDTAKVMAARKQAFQAMPAEPKIRAARDASMAYFMQRLPDPELVDLQAKSGRIPPSEGVIIDRNGKVVAQASGFADDHYLPFNLRNLQSLQGGAYVRTRTSGGLTTEDIYTGLLSGAREVTVVSHSGVFTVNFEEDFRGARRYNDKAKSMVERYAKTLDAVKSGHVERRRLDMSTKAAIRQEVMEDMSPWGASREEIEREYKDRLDRFSRSPMPRESELREIEAEAEEIGRQATADGKNGKRAAAEYYSQKIEELEERQVNRFYQLDGEGYAAALRAMKEQYPYYIKDVEYKTRRQLKSFGEEGRGRDFSQSTAGMPEQLNRFKRGTDVGYVAARHIRPERAMEGYYDVNIAGKGYEPDTGKTPAAFTNWANWEHNPTRNRNQRGASVEGEEGRSPAASFSSAVSRTAAMPERVRAERAASEKVKRQADQRKQARELLDEFVMPLRNSSQNMGNYPNLSAYMRNPDEIISDPEKMRATVREAVAVNGWNATNGPNDIARMTAQGRQSRLQALAVRLDSGEAGVTWDPEKHLGRTTAEPYAFDRRGFRPGDPPEAAKQILGAMDQDFAKMANGRKLSDMSDAQLRQLSTAAGKASQAWKDPSKTDPLEATAELANQLAGPQGAEELLTRMNRRFQANPSEASGYTLKIAENVEKARALKDRIALAGTTQLPPTKAGGGLPTNATADDLEAALSMPLATNRPAPRHGGGTATATKPTTVPRERLRNVPGYGTGFDLDDRHSRDELVGALANSLDSIESPDFTDEDVDMTEKLLKAIQDDDGKTADQYARRLLAKHRRELDDFTIKLMEGMFL